MTDALVRLNFRDLGGLPAPDGCAVRHGLLYRSEGPASFAAEHHAELVHIGFRLICDLRSDIERRIAPNDWNVAARVFNVNVNNDLRAETNAGWTALRTDPTEAGATAAMTLNYRAIPAALHPHLRRLIDAMLAGELPVLMHCTAGKDRTGVLAAILLRLLGVDRAHVTADYLRSTVFADNLRLAGSISEAFEHSFGFVPSEAAVNAIIGVSAAYLDAAFEAIDTHWGSLAAYAESAGIDHDCCGRLRAILLAAAPAHA